MTWRLHFLAITIAAGLSVVNGIALAPPQSPDVADWLTDGGDPQRTAWQQNERILTTSNVRNLRLLWKIQLDSPPREMHALRPPLVAGRVMTPQGPRQIAVVAGASDSLFGIDVEQGAVLWTVRFDRGFSLPRNGLAFNTSCPGGQVATPVLAPGTRPGEYVAYAVSWDGRLRTVDVATGATIHPPVPFVPPNAKPSALNLFDGVIYSTTGNRCGDTNNLVHAYDIGTKAVRIYNPDGGGMWGRTGPSISTSGVLFTGTGDGEFDARRSRFGQAIIGVTHNRATGTLALNDYFAPENAMWMMRFNLDMNVTGPVFTHGGREFIVQSSKECRVWLLDTSALGGADHRTPRDVTPQLCNEEASSESRGVWGAIATWADGRGERWVFVPFWGPLHAAFRPPSTHGPVSNGGVIALRVEDRNGWRLTPAWISRDMDRAEPPVVANGIVFGYGSGENTTQRSRGPRALEGTAARIAASTHAVLYALDAQTGDELWSSGSTIKSWNHFSGLSIANGRVYIGTYDGVLYCFGLMES